MKLTARQLAKALDPDDGQGTARIKARARLDPRPHGMNKGERAYANTLEAARTGGHIAAWWYEPEGLRLADRTVYWPDFRVQLPTGEIEFHEVKGRSGNRFWAKEDAWVKLKVAASVHHIYTFRVVWPRQGGGWESQEV